MIRAKDLEISDADAEKMPALFQRLRKAYLLWKTTGKLPNGEEWEPLGCSNE